MSLVCDSLVTRKLEILKVVEAFSHPTKRVTMDVRYINQTNNLMPRLLNSKQTKKRDQIIEQSVGVLSGQIGSRFRTFLCAIGPQSSFDGRLLSTFTNLRSLVLLYTVPRIQYKSMNEKLNQLLTAIVNLKQLVLDVGIDGYQAVLHTNHTLEQEKEFSCKDYFLDVTLLNVIPACKFIIFASIARFESTIF